MIGVVSISLAVVGGLGYVAVHFVEGSMDGDTPDIPDQPENESDAGMESIEGIEWDGQIRFYDEVSSAEAVAFKKSSFEDGEQPKNWGNYSQFSIEDATSDLYETEDYLQTSGENTSTLTFEDLPSDEYYVAVVDKSDPANYHVYFADTEMPEQIGENQYDRNQPVDLIDRGDLVRTATYGNDNLGVEDGEEAVVYDASVSNGVVGLDTPSEDTEDRERTVVRSIQVDRGTGYLGELDVTNLTDNSDAVSSLEVTVEANGFSESYDLTDEVGDSSTFNEELRDDMDSNPVVVRDDVTITVDVTYDAAASGTTSDSMIEEDQSIIEFELLDIYGDSVGSTGITTIEG